MDSAIKQTYADYRRQLTYAVSASGLPIVLVNLVCQYAAMTSKAQFEAILKSGRIYAPFIIQWNGRRCSATHILAIGYELCGMTTRVLTMTTTKYHLVSHVYAWTDIGWKEYLRYDIERIFARDHRFWDTHVSVIGLDRAMRALVAKYKDAAYVYNHGSRTHRGDQG